MSAKCYNKQIFSKKCFSEGLESRLAEISAANDAAAKALKEAGTTKLPNLYALKTEYKKLDAEILTPPRPAFSRRLPFIG
ncbi:hypothetical protein D7Y09_14640 [bacterium 1XD42-1]|nr:hypothetical protein D7X25_18570 [bacterium 1XD42-8]RKJ62053.1 hypothetical protein D7Y09_14640 [bacterium 1XD42-1]